jgi:hypothetical protein
MDYWESSLLPTLQILDDAAVRAILVKDAARFQWQKDKGGNPCVPDATLDMTHTALNTWLLMLYDFGLESVMLKYRDSLIADGLYAVLDKLDRTASQLLEEQVPLKVACPEMDRGLGGLGWPRLRMIYSNIWTVCPETATVDDVKFAIALLLIRFLLRYSPDDVKDTSSIDKFWEVNTKCKKYQTSVMEGRLTAQSFEYDAAPYTPHRTITKWMREITSEVLQTYQPVFYDDIAEDPEMDLPVGSLQDTCKCTFCKTLTYQTIFKRKFHAPARDGEYAVRLAMVNKNWKRKRLIAPEDMYHAVLERKNEREIDRVLMSTPWAGAMPLHNQDVSRAFARLGSVNGVYDTHDLSSASDSISRLLAYEVFPRRMHKLFDEFAYKVTFNKEVKTLYTFATSGNGLTFILEMILFFSICYVAARFSGYTRRDILRAIRQGHPLFIVYGDDIICHWSISSALKQLLEILGFTPNKKKSFTTKTFLYRESCGGEYWKGLDVSPFYWPRGFTNPDTCLPDEYSDGGKTGSFVALVNRFAYEEEYEWEGNNRTHQFLLMKLKQYYPKLSVGGAIIGLPSDSTYLCYEKPSPWDPADLDNDSIERVTIKYECLVEIKVKSLADTVWGVHDKTDYILPYRNKYIWRGGIKSPTERFIQYYHTGFKNREMVIGGVTQHYRGFITAVVVRDRVNALKRLKALTMEGKIKQYEDGTYYVDPKLRAQINGNSPFTDQSLMFTLREMPRLAEREWPSLAIASLAIDRKKWKLYGVARGDYEIHWKVKADGRIKAQDVGLPESLRYNRTELSTARVGHEKIDKPACLCHMFTAQMRRVIWDDLRYEAFLLNGPTYSRDVELNGINWHGFLDESLGITKKDRTFDEVYAGSVSKLVQKTN